MSKSLRYGLAAVVGLVMVVGFTGLGAAAEPTGYAVDPAHTSATFRIEHLGISWVAGRFNEMSGKCAIDKADPAKCAFEMTIKATSVDTGVAQRDTHLKSADFFDVAKFPEMTFKSTSVKKAATATQPADADAAYEVTGDFTLHGVTKPVTFILRGGKEAELPKGTPRVGFFGEFSLKRTDFGMDKLPGAVGNDVKIVVSFEATKQ